MYALEIEDILLLIDQFLVVKNIIEKNKKMI